jgi:plastocyanin
MRIKSLAIILGLACAGAAASAEFEVGQLNKAFAVTELKVKAGDTVSFKNNDPFAHNIFSLSDTKSFDLGSYQQGQTRKVVFDKPGTVEVECALHPGMTMTILVQK